MKFKTFFQRRSTTNMAESDSMSPTTTSAEATTTKRKKKDAKTFATTMKTAAVNTKAAFMTNAAAAAAITTTSEVHAASLLAQQNHCQPQPDEFADSIHHSCENCHTGLDCRMISGGVSRKDERMKVMGENLSQKVDNNMDFENANQQEVDYKYLLMKANEQIKELQDEVERMKLESNEKNKEFVELHNDFLLCIRASDRRTTEAEEKVRNLESKVAKLEQELLERGGGEGHDVSDGSGITTSDFNNASSPEPLGAASSPIQNFNDTEAMEGKKHLEVLYKSDGAQLPEKPRNFLNDSVNKRREEKLRVLRKMYMGSVRNGLLDWCQAQTKSYNIEITNFSSCWSNGLALAALVHSLKPDEFDYKELSANRAVDNFETALKAAAKLGVNAHLNAVKMIVKTENPPWGPIFDYVTEIYLHVTE